MPINTELHLTQLPPLSLYVHMPWCMRKCPYCDFNSHTLQGELPEQDYVAAVLMDLEGDLPKIWGRKIHAIFIGGGTPSLFSATAMDALLQGIRARLQVLPTAEITLEANPGAVDAEQFQGFKAAGINRLSIGIQSFNASALDYLQRIHDPQQALQAVATAQQAGFDNINLDIMFGLPQQQLSAALADLQQAVALKPQHISWYQLTIEPNTAFFTRPPPELPQDDALWDMQVAGREYLAAQGYQQYEISAYAQNGHQCRHNLNYWQFGDYLGIGAGAHSKLSDASQQQIYRFGKVSQPDLYIQTLAARQPDNQAVITGETLLTPADIELEFMLNALRMCNGFTEQQFIAHTGLAFAPVHERLQVACERGWLLEQQQGEARQFAPTATGLQFLNEMLELFV